MKLPKIKLGVRNLKSLLTQKLMKTNQRLCMV